MLLGSGPSSITLRPYILCHHTSWALTRPLPCALPPGHSSNLTDGSGLVWSFSSWPPGVNATATPSCTNTSYVSVCVWGGGTQAWQSASLPEPLGAPCQALGPCPCSRPQVLEGGPATCVLTGPLTTAWSNTSATCVPIQDW